MSAIERTLDLLRRQPDHRPLEVTPQTSALESLGPQTGGTGAVAFSVFVPEHQERAVQVAAEMMALARDEGVEAAVERAERAAEEVSVELAQHALMMFITHHADGQRLPLPALEDRAPEQVQPSAPPKPVGQLESLGAMGDEAALDWYREDIDSNFHHERWHVVYPTRGVPDPMNPFGPRRLKDRQGELFLYMHQQMLARYDAERLGAGLGKVEALFDYTAPLPEGYEPGLAGFDARQPDSLMADTTFQVGPGVLATWRDRLFEDIVRLDAEVRDATGHPVPVTPDVAGNLVESNMGSVNDAFYGSLHNLGHMVLALIPDPQQPGRQRGGVMQSTAVAIRDPIFYRWHRHVDDLLFAWQEEQQEQSFDDAPQVVLRNSLEAADGDADANGNGTGTADGEDESEVLCSPDLALVLDSVLDGADPAAFGEEHFGGDHWQRDPLDSGVATDDLETVLRERQVAGTTVSYLDHDDFHYFLRVENPLDAEQTVTVRLFLAPLDWAEERRHWIEMDKFQHTLASGRNIIPRSSKLSSVVRKPARRPGDPAPDPHRDADPNYCDCGWPYHLLLPRGTTEGLHCRLMVMLTDWDLDRVEIEGTCGSMSFCGKRDVAYPDRRPMGYPFDRRWLDSTFQTLLNQPHMAARDITIRAT